MKKSMIINKINSNDMDIEPLPDRNPGNEPHLKSFFYYKDLIVTLES